MEVLFEILFEFLGELLLQVVVEVLFEAGLHSLREPFRARPHPLAAGVGYAIFGVIGGALSLLFFPHTFMRTELGRLGNLLLAPIAAGIVMMGMGALRRRREQELIRLDRFFYGWLFAVCMAAVRFAFGS